MQDSLTPHSSASVFMVGRSAHRFRSASCFHFGTLFGLPDFIFSPQQAKVSCGQSNDKPSSLAICLFREPIFFWRISFALATASSRLVWQSLPLLPKNMKAPPAPISDAYPVPAVSSSFSKMPSDKAYLLMYALNFVPFIFSKQFRLLILPPQFNRKVGEVEGSPLRQHA